jgi:glycoside/pentoside/hexuronide:cation symporter, GPH family
MSDLSQSDAASNQIPQPEKLNFTTKLAYGAGDMGPAITANISVFFLLPFFTNVAGLPAGLAGSILMIGKIFDAINDPIIGIMSDRTRSGWGRRLPWIFYGTIPFGILFFLQWIVPHFSTNDAVNDWWLFSYYVLIGILSNTAFTAVNMPYIALTPELTQDYNERTSLNSFRFAFSIGSSIFSLIIAQIIFSTYPNEPETKYLMLGFICSLISVIPLFWCVLGVQERGAKPILNRQQKKNLGSIITFIGAASCCYGIFSLIFLQLSLDLSLILSILLGFLVVIFGLNLLFSFPEPYLSQSNAIAKRSEFNTTPSFSLKEQLGIVLSNKPFLYVIGIYLCSWLAVQLTASILLYFVVNYMDLEEQVFSLVAIAVQGTALVMLFFWRIVSEKIGKKAVYFIGSIFWIIAQVGLFLLKPGQTGLMYFLAVIAGFGISVAYLIPWSMVPDAIEIDELKTGQRREGIFYSFMLLVQKFGLALGLFLVGQALEWSGFVERVAGQPIPEQPESALLAIRLAIGPLPAIFLIGGLILAYFYPITKAVHDEIRLKLLSSDRQNTENL